MVMSAQKPSLLRVLSDSWRIICSKPLHFLALSSFFTIPNLVFIIIRLFTSPHPISNSNYGPLLSLQDSGFTNMEKSQIISLLLIFPTFFLLNICFIISTTHSIFHGFHNRPFKLSSSLKSIASSFLPLLAAKMAYLLIMAVFLFGFTLLMALFMFGLLFLGLEIEPNTTHFTVTVYVLVAAFMVGYAFLEVELILMDASAVMESKWGFSAVGRSRSLVKAAKGVAWRIIIFFWALIATLWALYSILVSASGGGRVAVVVGMVAHVAVSAFLLVLSSASNTVLFVYCKGEGELPVTDEKVKLQGQVYIQLPRDVDLESP